MKNPFLLSRRAIMYVFWILIAGGFVLFAFAYILIYQPPNFTGYESTRKLNGTSVKKTELIYTSVDKFVKMGVVYKKTYDSGVVLYNSKNRFDWDTCADRKDWYISWNYSCEEGELTNGVYLVSVSKKDGQITEINVDAEIGGTSIFLSIPDDMLEEYADYDGWKDFFAHMQPRCLFFTPMDYQPTPHEF